MYQININLYKINLGDTMEFSKIQPFVRYVHYLPINKHSAYVNSIPYDNRLFYLLQGHIAIKSENTIYKLNEGDIIIIPAGTKYHIVTQNQKASVLGVNFDYTQNNFSKSSPIPPTDTQTYNPNMKLENITFSDAQSLNGILHIKGLSPLYVKLIKLEQEYSQKMLYFNNITSNLLSEILIECVRVSTIEKLTAGKDIINNITAYINENYNAELTNSELGMAFNLHPNYINKLMKTFTGMSLHKYLIHIRISHSVEMLESKTKTIGEIAESCGFCDIYHYSKTFKKVMGVSPSKYI